MAQKGPVAVIEIGSTGIRLIIAEIEADGTWKVKERGGKPIGLGREVFVSEFISRDSMLQCLSVLNGFKELIKSWGIEGDRVRVIATSALREARNRDAFIDRVRLQTGFKINVVEGIEENRLMYLGVQYAVRERRGKVFRSNSMILEVGGGSTELMLLRRGKMVAAHSLRIGTVRIDQQVRSTMGSGRYLQRYLEENIRTTCESLSNELPLQSVRHFIVIGSDARLAASKVGKESNENFSIIDKAAFEGFVSEIKGYSTEDCVEKLHLPYTEAEGLITGLLTAMLFLEKTKASEVVVPNVSIREGVLISMAEGPDPELQEEFYGQVLASAVNLGRKFHFDEQHSLHVRKLAVSLFDQLEADLGLGRRERLLLEAAGILHDIGAFIRTSGHHRHSEYIISNSEIFGLHEDDLTIVANVVRYHRKSPPNSSHVNFVSLSREDRIIVLKLAAILRVADALDRGHTQRVSDIKTEKREDSVILRTDGVHDLSLERLSLAEKADMFEEVFGLRVVLS